MGQRIFILTREPALRELLGATASDDQVRTWGGAATFLLMVGWATGGILFGTMSDRFGRVKAMVVTLLAYTVFSGLSGLARSGIEFLAYRFLFGFGVGGMFGAATTLVAESVPAHFRTLALGSMQALSACGNILASGLSLTLVPSQEGLWGRFSGWQVLCFVGIAPVLLAVPMIALLKEPEAWKKAKADAASGKGKRVGSLADLVGHPRWKHNLRVGICLGIAGMAGLWGIAFFSPELITTAFKTRPLQASEIRNPAELCLALTTSTDPAAMWIRGKISPDALSLWRGIQPRQPVSPAIQQALVTELNRILQKERLCDEPAFAGVPLKKHTRNLIQLVRAHSSADNVVFLNRQLLEQALPGSIAELQKTIDRNRSRGTLLQDVGALIGMFTFTFVASYFNRRSAFLGAFLLCLGTVFLVFYGLKQESHVSWMLPMMGFATLSVFAGYSIYFPELFPTRLRGTGVGFCYNTVRYLAAPFPFLLAWLGSLMSFRYAAIIMSSVYLVGIVALLWAPETKGKPLPED
jgi:MFS family permease